MIDLHTHSTASDGSCTPRRLIELALAAGLSALALTDHDTLDGVEQARESAAGTGLRFIAGVEIEISVEHGEFHLLGLGLSDRRADLEGALVRLREERHARNLRMVDRFQRGGIPISMDELTETAGGKVVSRAHFARVLVRKKVVGSLDAAFSRFIGKGQPYYEARTCLPLEEAARLIRQAGGISVIAHPVSLGLRGPALRVFLSLCRDRGVTGIEAWHPNQTLSECRKFEKLARSLGMVVTGGSDFHGEHMPHRMLGFTALGRAIPDEFLSSIPLHLPKR
ncbi:MAG TPA: PHP domain-containing protein [Spirochaetia bacterium]|nr:PHP domain-containing protein [Spirochaetia bacterium]